MLRKFLLLIFAVSFVGIFQTTQAFASEINEWQILEFNSDVSFNKDRSINIKETITVNYSSSKRGIVRQIPEKYSSSGTLINGFTLPVDVIGVTDEKGKLVTFTTSRESGYMNIKIGDEDIFITGQKTYIISYKISDIISFFNDYDELYYNVTGVDWVTSIAKASYTLSIPEELNNGEFKFSCFTGVKGSKAQDCVGSKVANSLYVEAQNLDPNEGLTVVAGFSKGYFKEPTFLERYGLALFLNSGFLLPIPFSWWAYNLWKSKGKDPVGKNVIVPQFNRPEELTPGESGLILDDKVDNIDITATIIDLAIRGFLTIREEKAGILKSKSYKLVVHSKETQDLKDHEATLYNYFYINGKSVTADDKQKEPNDHLNIKDTDRIYSLSDVQENILITFESVKDKINHNLTTSGLYTANPTKVRSKYVGIGVGVGAVIFIFLGTPLIAIGATGTLIGLVICTGILGILGFVMPQKSMKGVELKEYLLGMKEYISIAEKDRIKVMQDPDSPYIKAPDNSIELYEKLLPYAIIFGVSQAWGKKFEGMYTEPPQWYSTNDFRTFNSLQFMNSINAMSSSIGNSIVPAAASGGFKSGSGFSSGGGFSGGGGGGGGGHSW